MRPLPLIALLACDPVPPACPALCAEAAAALSPCVEAQGLSWSAYGYEDQADFQDACDTWAWEQARMAQHASARQGGGGQGLHALEARCVDLSETFATGTCEEQLSVRWGDEAWR